MPQSLPSYRKPPVIETALSVQFNPIKGFGNAHLGLFWQQMREQYPKWNDAEPIEPQEEAFGGLRQGLPSFRFATGHRGVRLQMISPDEHLMVQVQNGRLVYNWRRLDEHQYPRWKQVFPGFQEALSSFNGFLKSENLPGIVSTQWEVTYVNKIIRGREWEDYKEWADVVPGLLGTAIRSETAHFETVGTSWHFILPDKTGRLHVDMTHGFDSPEEDAEEFLILQLTARGGIDEENDRNLEWGLSQGHEAIVYSFTEITGKTAQEKIWKREK